MSALSGLEGIPAHAPGHYTTTIHRRDRRGKPGDIARIKAGIEAAAGMIPD
jgi:hypothetical protein